MKKLYPDVWNREGKKFHGKKDFTNAIRCFKNAVSLNQTYVEAYVNLGITYSDAGLTDEAVKAFTRASVLDPLYMEKFGVNINERKKPDYEIFYMEARRAFLRADYNYAIDCISQALKVKPEYPDYRNLAGEIYIKVGKYEKARFNIEKALELNPGYEKAKKNLSEILYFKGLELVHDDMTEEGIRLWKKAIKIYPDIKYLKYSVNIDFNNLKLDSKCTNCEEFSNSGFNYCPYCGLKR